MILIGQVVAKTIVCFELVDLSFVFNLIVQLNFLGVVFGQVAILLLLFWVRLLLLLDLLGIGSEVVLEKSFCFLVYILGAV